MIKKTSIAIISSLILLSACSSDKSSHAVKALQKKDKKLSCKEILLEMNEADFYKKMAYKNKGPRLKNVLMPLGYISTYMDAEEAINAADARVDYLDKIYDIMRCEQKAEQEDGQQQYNNVVPYSVPYGYGSVPAAPINYQMPPQGAIPVYPY